MRIFKSEVKEMQTDGKQTTASPTPITSERVEPAPAPEPSTEQRPA
jgi:sec-independent protein translocase protein TatA